MLISSVIVGRKGFRGCRMSDIEQDWRKQYDRDELLEAGLITVQEWVMWDKQGCLPCVELGEVKTNGRV